MKMVSFIINDDGTFSPCSQGGEWFLAKLDREKLAKVIFETARTDYRKWESLSYAADGSNKDMALRQSILAHADALIKYLTE